MDTRTQQDSSMAARSGLHTSHDPSPYTTRVPAMQCMQCVPCSVAAVRGGALVIRDSETAARERVRASGRNGEYLPPCLLAARLGQEPVVWTCAVICVIRHYVCCMHLAAPLSQPACSVVWGRWPSRFFVPSPLPLFLRCRPCSAHYAAPPACLPCD